MTGQLASLQEVLGDRYQLEGELGHGGMSTVYRALDRKLNRPVAIKVLSPELALILGSDRFRREIDIATKLQHPNIVPLFDSGGKGDVLFYVMPLISGETLRERLERETQLSLEDALRIIRDVADAVGYAHSQGFVHRDIKPENILLAAGRVYVADFGIARAIDAAGEDRLTSAGIVLGTPAYMSPEQAGGKTAVDGRADLYAMGCVLYEMLAGTPPFAGATPQAVLAQQLSAPVPSLRILRDTVPAGIEAVIQKALAKVPADRYATASRLIAAIDAPDVGSPDVLPPVARASFLVRSALMAAVLVILVGLGVWRWRVTRLPLDPEKVLIFPLVERGLQASEQGSGQTASLALVSALERTEPLRVVDGWRALDPEQRNNPAQLTERTERRLARARGAGRFVDGSIARLGDSTRVSLRLYDVGADSEVTHASASAASSEPTHRSALRAVGNLIPALVGPSAHIDLSYFSNRDPAAEADWLHGEREYRRAAYSAAMMHYQSALARDSTMAVAALKAAEAATWVERYPAADSLVALALRHSASLPMRNARFASGLHQYLSGSADSAVIEFQAAIAADPAWSEPWAALGEVYAHLMPSGGAWDSLSQHAFTEAVTLDPEFGPALFHLAEFTVRLGNARDADRLVERYRLASVDTGYLVQLQLMRGCTRDSTGMDWRQPARLHPVQALHAGRLLSAGVGHARCAAGAFAAVLASDSASAADRYSAMQGLHYLDLALGRRTQATALADSVIHAGNPAAQALVVFDALIGERPDSQAALIIASLDVPPVRAAAGVQWFLGYWASHRGDKPRLDALAGSLARIADSSGEVQDRQAAGIISARAALARGDTTRAITLLESMQPAGATLISRLVWRWWYSAPTDRMLLAELLLARGRAADALRVAETFDGAQAIVNLACVPWSLELRIRAAQALGWSDRSARYRARLSVLRSATAAAAAN